VGEVEIGYGIAPEFGGRGYMTEAVRALIAWAFEHPDCHTVIAAGVLKTNLPSIRVVQKAGMTCYRATADMLFWRIRRTTP
jgi:RimJ/RimL family protein N-acetyltransferase